jgi:hypothetical protein
LYTRLHTDTLNLFSSPPSAQHGVRTHAWFVYELRVHLSNTTHMQHIIAVCV